jgi:hypothetical protein
MTAVSLLTADVVIATLICPVTTTLAPTRRVIALAAAGAALWILSSAATLAAAGLDLRSIGIAHLVLMTAALASAGTGRALRTLFSDPLDAVAIALGASLVASFGVFAMGRVAGELPPHVLDATLAANPLVAVTSAANIDIFRTEMLYRTSPVAHQMFNYPAWQQSAGLFIAIAATAAACAWWSARRAALRRV